MQQRYSQLDTKTDSITILAIESSCDDTGAAIIKDGKILANVVAGQAIHQQYGGVIPELASRAHQQNIVPVVDAALKKANISTNQLNAIAYTQGPGLMGSLLVGSQFAKGMAWALQIPTIGVNHLQAHVASIFIENKDVTFPFLCLLVSGGHTQIIFVKNYSDMEIIGQTIDDAAGEAFDKAAKMMNIAYPGGPLIDKLAIQGDEKKYNFPKAQIPQFDYSFSGLKTSILYFLQKQEKINVNFIEENKADLCASIQKVIVDTLLQKFEKAMMQYEVKDIALTGGVSANSKLRKQFIELANKYGCTARIPSFEYCTDNAAMIAVSGYYKFLNKEFSSLHDTPYTRNS